MIKIIISGGQTGSDQGGMYGAKSAGIETGGIAPKNYKTEIGDNPNLLKDIFGLTECSNYSYTPRTIKNVQNSDVTMIFACYDHSPGTTATIRACRELDKRYCVINPYSQNAGNLALDFIVHHDPSIINIAGNRESVHPGIQRQVCSVTFLLLTEINQL